MLDQRFLSCKVSLHLPNSSYAVVDENAPIGRGGHNYTPLDQ
jgi:hypothetical protein